MWFKEGRWFLGGNQESKFLFMLIAADSRWVFGVEEGGELFPSNLFLELNTKLNEIVFSFLIFISFYTVTWIGN